MRLLLVEDSARLRESLAIGLRACSYAVDCAADGEAALRYALHNPYDVIVLDLMIPLMDGMTVLRRLRAAGGSAHVLILTARDAVHDRVLGLKEGADDYLVKPFSFDELLARLEALLRRRYECKNPVIQIASLCIDTSARCVRRHGAEIRLSRREYAMLEYLAFRKGEVVTREELEDHLYGDRDFPMSNAVDRILCTLRRKIETSESDRLIETRRGEGFRLREPGS